MTGEKYIVFKKEDWEAFRGGVNIAFLDPVPDAHVFRDQDVFTPTVLFAYANAIRNTVEIMTRMGAAVSVQEIVRLNNMADDFMDAAEKASAAHYRHLPD